MMRKKKRRQQTADEFLKELEADPEWVARQEARERKRQALSGVLIAAEAPLVAALREAGFDVRVVSDLFNRKEPWRKDVPIPPWPEAVPILVEHLQREYPFEVKEAIVRALTPRFAHSALAAIVNEFRRTADPEVAAEEQRRSVEIALAGAGEYYTREELEELMRHQWESYRFALANAIGNLMQKEDVPIVVELLRDEKQPRQDRGYLARDLAMKMRRWRRKDPEILELVESLRDVWPS